MNWNDGHPAHTVAVDELVVGHARRRTPRLWHTILSLDLVGTITSRAVAIDDPLPLLLENPRAVRTTGSERRRLAQRT